MKKILILFLLIFFQQTTNFSHAGDEKKKKSKAEVKKDVVTDVNKEKKQAGAAENDRLKTKSGYEKTKSTNVK